MESPSPTDKIMTLHDMPEQAGAKVYTLPEQRLLFHLRRAALQGAPSVLIIAILLGAAGFAFPADRVKAVILMAGISLVLLALTTMFGAAKRDKALWQRVKVEVGDESVSVHHQGVPSIRLLPEPEIRLARDQVAVIRETEVGLVLSTPYEAVALIIPVHLAQADYQEIKTTLSTWYPIQPGPSRAKEGLLPLIRARARDHQEHRRSLLFYERSSTVFAAGPLVGCIVGVIPGVLIIVEWSRGQEHIPTGIGALIASAYVAGIFISLVGCCVPLAWLDYGLARLGVGLPTRTGIWAGVAASTILAAFAVTVKPGLLGGLLIVATGALIVGAAVWMRSLPKADTYWAYDIPMAAEQEHALLDAAADARTHSPVQGAYRLTLDVLYEASGNSIMVQPRFRGPPPYLSALLPRSVSLGAVRKLFANHPHRFRIIHFSVDESSFTWKVGEHENSVGWEEVTEVTRTPMGFLIFWRNQSFDWIPRDAFFAGDGPENLAQLAQSRAKYREIDHFPMLRSPDLENESVDKP